MSIIRQGPHEPISNARIVVADTETTGLHPYGNLDCLDPHGADRICSIAMVHLDLVNGIWELGDRLSLMLDPGRPLGEVAAQVNGLHWSGDGTPCPLGRIDLAGLPTCAEAASSVLAFIGNAPVCCHNTAFDVAFIDAELERAGLPALDTETLCTKKAFSDLLGQGRPNAYVPGTSQDKLCDLLGIDRSARPEVHDAMADAELTVPCLLALNALGWLLPEPASSLPHRHQDVRAAA